jgi:two-component system response regulator NreC
MQKIKIMVVDDHTVLRDGIRTLISLHDDLKIVGEASDGEEAVKMAHKLAPDVVIMDLALPGIDGIEAIHRIRKKKPRIKVLVLSQYDDKEHVLSSIKAGADGYLPKIAASSELVSAIRTINGGESFLYSSAAAALINDYRQQVEVEPYDHLTAREREILTLTANGHSSRQIAEILVLSSKTVQIHRQKIMDKLDIHQRAELIKYAIRKGLVSP